MAEPAGVPTISWDSGTAYDFFISLNVINSPAEYGLRPSWAAGIRSRLSPTGRMVFSNVMGTMLPSLWWINTMPQPKQARNVLELLEGMKSEEILPSLCSDPACSEEMCGVSAHVLKKGSWDESDVELFLQEESREIGSNAKKAINKDSVRRWLDWWARPAEFGAALRAGLREYYENFFREEERRIAPDLERSLDRAREMASRLPVSKLFEELSQGVRLENVLTAGATEIRLAPCYWITPRILYDHCHHNGVQFVIFGARPPEASLIPGDVIPARLLLSLEAMSDPTRLSILRAVGETPMTQAEIARKLRLRPPTISHHLKSLRLAGLIAYVGTEKGETRYAARAQQVEESCAALKDFLGPQSN